VLNSASPSPTHLSSLSIEVKPSSNSFSKPSTVGSSGFTTREELKTSGGGSSIKQSSVSQNRKSPKSGGSGGNGLMSFASKQSIAFSPRIKRLEVNILLITFIL
jgi:hypothetical protein